VTVKTKEIEPQRGNAISLPLSKPHPQDLPQRTQREKELTENTEFSLPSAVGGQLFFSSLKPLF